MAKTIKFVARDPLVAELQPKPVPVSQNIPQWWRDQHPYEKGVENPDGKKLLVTNFISNATFKKCTPMLDALTAGYLVSLWSDVQVRPDPSGIPLITWRVRNLPVFWPHGSSSQNIEPPTGYSNTVVKYNNGWIPKTPPGYSILVTTPLGHRNLPFHAIPAIIDSDRSTLEIVPPMWVKEGFEGIVEKGTPLFQIIPFKRDDWKAEYETLKPGEYSIIEDKNFNSTIVSHYIKKAWSKKSFK